jgi:hypothetical protein
MPLSATLPMLLIGSLSANAAEVTHLAPALRGDFEIRYDLEAEHARLMEGEESVGKRRLMTNTVTYALRFSPMDGLGLFVEVPHFAGEGVRFTDTNTMSFDPREDRGVMAGSPSMADPAITRGSGVGGTWIGISGTPLSLELFEKRKDRTSWKIDFGFRFKDKTSFYSYGPRDTRGAGTGAPALRLRTAISGKHRKAQPYLVADMVKTLRVTTDVVDADGTVVAEGLELRPASYINVRPGVEWMVAKYGEDGAQVSVDLHGQFGYRSPQELPSGIYLPSILDASADQVASMSERTEILVGTGVNWRFMEYVQLNVGADFGANSGGRVEHFYDVNAQVGAVEWQVHTALRFRARDPMFDGLKDSAAQP